MAIVSFFPVLEDVLAVGAMVCGTKERKAFAERSPAWVCPDCKKSNGQIAEEFMQTMTEEAADAEMKAAGEGSLATQLNLESEASKKQRLTGKADETADNQDKTPPTPVDSTKPNEISSSATKVEVVPLAPVEEKKERRSKTSLERKE